MSNANGTGQANGSEAPQAQQVLPPGMQRVQATPQEAANYALQFLGRAMFNRQERQAFDVAEALLRAIVTGELTVSPGQQPQQPLVQLEPTPRA